MNDSLAMTRGAAAARLRQANEAAAAMAPLRLTAAGLTLDDAYAIQLAGEQAREGAGVPLAGRKVAMTSQAVQQQFGIAHPTSGFLDRTMVHLHGDTLAAKALLQPRAEAEIAFVLKRDLEDPQCSYVELLRAIDFALVAIEIADCRIDGWQVDVLDFVADNSAAARVVLGETPLHLAGADLRSMAMQMQVNGQVRSQGCGADCLGSPVLSLLWLARHAAGRAVPLRAGQLVMAGSLGPPVPVVAGDRIDVRIGHLPVVTACLA